MIRKLSTTTMDDSSRSQEKHENRQGSPCSTNLRAPSMNLDIMASPQKTTETTGSIAKNQNFVDHTYHDFSRYFDRGGGVVRHMKAGKNFPAKLHRILSDAHYSHLISWMVSHN